MVHLDPCSGDLEFPRAGSSLLPVAAQWYPPCPLHPQFPLPSPLCPSPALARFPQRFPRKRLWPCQWGAGNTSEELAPSAPSGPPKEAVNESAKRGWVCPVSTSPQEPPLLVPSAYPVPIGGLVHWSSGWKPASGCAPHQGEGLSGSRRGIARARGPLPGRQGHVGHRPATGGLGYRLTAPRASRKRAGIE